MLKPITKTEAFSLLLDEKTASKVYVKSLGEYSYLRADDHRFTFGTDIGAINVRLADFYIEEREAE